MRPDPQAVDGHRKGALHRCRQFWRHVSHGSRRQDQGHAPRRSVPHCKELLQPRDVVVVLVSNVRCFVFVTGLHVLREGTEQGGGERWNDVEGHINLKTQKKNKLYKDKSKLLQYFLHLLSKQKKKGFLKKMLHFLQKYMFG